MKSLDALRQHVMNHMAVHVGKTPLQSVMIESETLVIQSDQVQDRRVQIMHGDDILDRLVPEVVRCAVAEPLPHPRTRQPGAETPVVMLPALVVRAAVERRAADLDVSTFA